MDHTNPYVFHSDGSLAHAHPYGHKADIYFLGCLLFDLATKKETSRKDRIPSKLASYSNELRDLIDKMLKTDSDQRPNTDQILTKKLIQPYFEKYAKTIINFDRAIPDDSAYHFVKGKALLSLQRFPEAIACFDSAISTKPDDPDFYSMKGKVLFNLNEYEKAFDFYEKAIHIKPNDANLSILYARTRFV